MQTFAEQNEVEINFLHPHGSARSFHYPRPSDLLTVSAVAVLPTGLQPTTSTGRAYTLNAHELHTVTIALDGKTEALELKDLTAIFC